MRIGIDGRWVARSVGLGSLSRNLIKSLADLDQVNTYFIYVNTLVDITYLPTQANFIPRIIGNYPYPISEQIILPWFLNRDKLDLFHATLGTAPLLTKIPTMATVADAMFAMPRTVVPARKSIYQRLGGWYRRLVVPITYRQSKVVVTISNKSKEDLLQWLGPKKDLEVVYLASGLGTSVDSRESLNNFKLPLEYILSLSGTDPRKNTRYLVESYLQTKLDIPLVLAGTISPDLSEIINRSKNLGKVIFLGRVTDLELARLYQKCLFFVFPSLYEGFGLPLVEAMSFGAPVLALDTGANREIAGEGARIVQPKELADALTKMAQDEKLRVKLTEAGLVRSKQFSWQDAARKYLKIYQKATR